MTFTRIICKHKPLDNRFFDKEYKSIKVKKGSSDCLRIAVHLGKALYAHFLRLVAQLVKEMNCVSRSGISEASVNSTHFVFNHKRCPFGNRIY